MATKQIQPKQPKTIKVKTVVIALLVTTAIIASFIGGWFARSVDQSRVQSEARVLVTELKSQK